ncbi:3-oxoacyl-[acyl-carrier-protein] synthase I, chloroplastic-like [Iris pallida]|uniref:3-oxoacyl-[acyl-carrier-protein] synthase I, chloroplastic-like n=1 Tax=Iris pallida TaxID=29817 RepID=A0AAX6GK67_IRIPA|nr:3-oxoacyl-[acyl-carrier-protein] synthase I, chloroplastic-like [Iris pallida]
MGLVSVFDNVVNLYYVKMLEGESGIGHIDRFDPSKFPTRFVGHIRGIISEVYIEEVSKRAFLDGLESSQVVGEASHLSAYSFSVQNSIVHLSAELGSKTTVVDGSFVTAMLSYGT